MNTKAVGDASEAVVTARLLLKGFTVLRPVGDNQRYDLVIVRDGQFQRVQVKTGKLRAGAIWFNTCNRVYAGTRKDYRADIEFFAVYEPLTDTCHLVPVDEVGLVTGNLRIEEPKNKQVSKVRWAKDYLL